MLEARKDLDSAAHYFVVAGSVGKLLGRSKECEATPTTMSQTHMRPFANLCFAHAK